MEREHPTRSANRAADESSVDLVARVYHTENGNVHAEGETYTITNRALAETLRGIGFVSIDGWTEGPAVEAPAVESLAPDTAAIGAPDFTVHVTGTGFTPDAVIVFNGFDEPTTVVSDTEVTTGVNMAVWQAPVSVPVQVRAGGNLSNSKIFTFTAATRRDDGGPHQGQIDPPHRHPGHVDPPTHRGR
jgi:hypothetical protein